MLKVKKALLTFAVGAHIPYLEISLPSFFRYACLHHYDLVVPQAAPAGRPPAWGKIPAILSALRDYSQVLWMDADCFIADPRQDIASLLPAGSQQALVAWERAGSDPIPNSGVWLVTREMVPMLHQVWENVRWINHCWWEQASLIDLMGFEINDLKIRQVRTTDLFKATHLLPLCWNASAEHEIVDAKIRHATKTQDRLGLLRKWSQQARS